MNQRAVLAISLTAALGGLLFGFDTAVISGAIPYLTTYFQLDSQMLGWAVSCILIGCALGALSAGKLADLYGRRTMLFICAVLFAASGIGAGLATSFTVFIFFRLIGGLGVGAAAMVSPMYIAETAPDKQRGRLVSLYQLAIMLGILLAYVANYSFDGTGPDAWRWMFAAQAAPALMFGLLLFVVVPESPRWLVLKGRSAAALTLLEKLEGKSAAQHALAQITESFREASQVRMRDLWRPPYRKVMLVGILVAVFQQVTGINAILYYAPVIFKETGLDTSSSILQTIGIGVVNVAATFIAIGLVDRLGRKIFLVGGSLVMGLTLAALALCFHFSFFGYYIVLILLLVYVGAFCCTLGAVTWVYLSEIFPNRVRGLGLSVATLALWLADFLVAYAFPVMTAKLGTPLTLATYAVCCGIALLYFSWKLPETKDRSLEEIETLFI